MRTKDLVLLESLDLLGFVQTPSVLCLGLSKAQLTLLLFLLLDTTEVGLLLLALEDSSLLRLYSRLTVLELMKVSVL